MKKYSIPALALVIALAAAGCSSASGDDTSKTSASASSKEEKTSEVSSVKESKEEENPGTPVETESNSVFTAFKDAGYTAEDENTVDGAQTAVLGNDDGTFDASVETLEDADKTTEAFSKNFGQLESDGYLEVNSAEEGGKTIRLMLNDYNTVYAVVASDSDEKTVITLQDIPEGANDSVLAVLKTLGYPTDVLSE